MLPDEPGKGLCAAFAGRGKLRQRRHTGRGDRGQEERTPRGGGYQAKVQPVVVLDSQIGLIVEEGDVDSMAAAMIKLAQDPALSAHLGTAARERAVAHFTMEQHINQLAAMIRQNVDAHGLKQ